MLTTRRSRRTRAAADSGMTLVELLISMTLLAIVITLSTGFLTFALDKNSNLSQATSASNMNQTGMEILSRVIRQGVYPTGWTSNNPTIIQSGSSPTTLIVTSRLSSTGTVDSTVRKYTFTLSGTTLYWQQANLVPPCSATGACTWATPTAQKVLMRGVQTSSTVCPGNTAYTDGPFHYVQLNATGSPVTLTDGSPTTTELPTISYVTINFYTQTQTGPQKPACMPLSDYVDLRNKT